MMTEADEPRAMGGRRGRWGERSRAVESLNVPARQADVRGGAAGKGLTLGPAPSEGAWVVEGAVVVAWVLLAAHCRTSTTAKAASFTAPFTIHFTSSLSTTSQYTHTVDSICILQVTDCPSPLARPPPDCIVAYPSLLNILDSSGLI